VLPLSDAEVVAGEAGLDQEVSWPAVLRVRPPAFEPLSGHELVIVSTEALHLLDESLTLGQLIGRLSERNVSAIAVVGRVDANAIERAEAARIPLLVLPESVHFSELGPAITRVIADQRARLYQLGLDAQHQFAEVSMAGRGLVGIVERLARVSGRSVLLWDAYGGILQRIETPGVPFPTDLDAEGSSVRAELLREQPRAFGDSRSEPPTTRINWPGGRGLVAPVVVRDAVVAYLMLVDASGEFADEDQVFLARGSLVCALEMAKQDAVTEAERRLRGDFFDDLLVGPGGNESAEALINRGQHLGYDLQRTYVVLAITPDRPEWTDGRVVGAVERLAREVHEYLNGRGAIGLVAQRRQTIVLFLGSDGVADVNAAVRFAENLRDYLNGPVGVSVSIGLGSYHPGIAGLRVAYHEAEQAYQIGREFFGLGQVTAYGDLGVYRLLYAFRESNELAAFCEETLASLTEYDLKNGASLVDTLEVYFRCDASLRLAAEALYLHRNSLAYRLRRISEITGLNLDSLEDRFRLQLALKSRRLVRGPAGQQPIAQRT
jgi:purine catabolism regulator